MAEHEPGARGAAQLLLKAVNGLEQEERELLLKDLLRFLLELKELPLWSATARLGFPPGVWSGPQVAMGGFQGSPRDFEVVRLLADGVTPSDVARRLDIAEKAVRSHARSVHMIASSEAVLSRQEEVLLARFAQGKARAEIAAELGVSEEMVHNQVQGVLERVTSGRWWRYRRPEAETLHQIVGKGASVSGGQQVPVRLSDEQHRRLKEWCAEHNFSMAVVIRGLVERFLDEQDRLAS